jgi:prophage regulatory protein
MASVKIIRLPAVLARTGLGKSTLYQRVTQGLHSPPVKLGGARASGWPEHEVDALISARIAGRSNDEIRQLVTELVAARVGDGNARGVAQDQQTNRREEA